MEDTVTVTASDLEAALRDFVKDIDYDLHKSLESDEWTGEDHYPGFARYMFRFLGGGSND